MILPRVLRTLGSMVITKNHIVVRVCLAFFIALVVLMSYLAASLYVLQQELAKCVHSDNRIPEARLSLLGTVTKVTQKDSWVVTEFQLCQSSRYFSHSFLVYTPKSWPLYNQGEMISSAEGAQGYHWVSTSTQAMPGNITGKKLMVFRPDILSSDVEVRSRFSALDGFACEDEKLCYEPLSFLRQFGAGQISTVVALKNKATWNLFISLLLHRATLFGYEFGPVDSAATFQSFTKAGIL